MNIFVLSEHPREAAQMHLDKHVVKMIIEYAQLLSTAHRLLDGKFEERIQPDTGRKKKFWLLPGERLVLKEYEKLEVIEDGGHYDDVLINGTKYVIENPLCYSLSHQNHPCAVWARETDANYCWLSALFFETAREYTHRYGKIHKTITDIGAFLMNPPKNIATGDLTPFPQAMGDEFKVHDDPVAAYRNYYLGPKAAFARWTNRPAPSWFKASYKDYNASTFERTTAMG